MRAATNALALCVVLALTNLPARCQHDESFTEGEEGEPMCEDSLKILVASPIECQLYSSGTKNASNKVSIAQVTEVYLKCTGKVAENLYISRNGKKLITYKSGRKSIAWFTRKLDLQQSKYLFTCIDTETTCERSVTIIVTPILEVISPTVQICNLFFPKHYAVQYGNSMSVLCSGPDAARLVMSKDGKTLPTKRRNETTIESFETTQDLRISEYVCTDVVTTYNSSVIIKVIPKIYSQSRNETILPYLTYHPSYEQDFCRDDLYYEYSGFNIQLFCSGPRAVKIIGQKEHDTIPFNENTVYINITKLGRSEYTCSDSTMSKYLNRVRVIVVPRMEVTTPSARFVGLISGVRKYSVIYGHSFEIICSGPEASVLTIHEELRIIDLTNSLEESANNKSTVRYIVNKAVWEDFTMYICSEQGSNAMVGIAVSVLPAVTDFRFVSYNLQFFNCTWTLTNDKSNNTLFLVENGILTQICDNPLTSRRSKFCTYEYDNKIRYSKVLSFLMQSCCDDGCFNQTFDFDHLYAVKLAPPEGLKLLKITSRSAVLEWNIAAGDYLDKYLTPLDRDFHYKVQYWYSGIEPRNVNSSLVTCDNKRCKIELDLPCPGQSHEVRIYHKLKRTVKDEFWSDPSSMYLITDENSNTNNIDPTCKQESLKTKEVMRFIVHEFKNKMRPEIEPMKQKIQTLKEKLANIRKYLASTKEQGGQ